MSIRTDDRNQLTNDPYPALSAFRDERGIALAKISVGSPTRVDSDKAR
jgi:hypothetical protein